MDSRTRRTILRKAQTSDVNNVSESFFNFYQFNGINDSQNYATVDQNSFADANNMFVNTDDVLVTRPPVKETKFIADALDIASDMSKVEDTTDYGTTGDGVYNGGNGNSDGTGTGEGDNYSGGGSVTGDIDENPDTPDPDTPDPDIGYVILHIYNWLSTTIDYISTMSFVYTDVSDEIVTIVPEKVNGVYQVQIPTNTDITINNSALSFSLTHTSFIIGKNNVNYDDIDRDIQSNAVINIPNTYGTNNLDLCLYPLYIYDNCDSNNYNVPMHIDVSTIGYAANTYNGTSFWQEIRGKYTSIYNSYHYDIIGYTNISILSNDAKNAAGNYDIPRYINIRMSLMARQTDSADTGLTSVHIGLATNLDDAKSMALTGVSSGEYITIDIDDVSMIDTTINTIIYIVYFGAYDDDAIYLDITITDAED